MGRKLTYEQLQQQAQLMSRQAAFQALTGNPIEAVRILRRITVPKYPTKPMTVRDMALFFIAIGYYGECSVNRQCVETEVRNWLRQTAE